jgi:SAM-dependent methyltransferase
VGDEVFGRLRDRLAVNAPYVGLVAEGYDAWISVDEAWPDDAYYDRLVAAADGPVLELGCGTGRPLLRWLAAGHDVEGIDSSADMLAALRRHAEERGLAPVVHLGDFAPLALARTYAAIVCPAGTFTLVEDEARAADAVTSYVRHLRPGGTLAVSLYAAESPADGGPGAPAPLTWRVRRTGTTADGRTIVVHEAFHHDPGTHLQVAYNRVEAYDADGRLLEAWLRRHHLRVWPRDDAEALFAGAGLTDVRSHGPDVAWVTTGRRPA